MTLRFSHHGAVYFFGRHFDLVDPPDLGQQKTKSDPPFGNLAILGLEFIVTLAFVVLVNLVRMMFPLMLKLLPDGIELHLDHILGQLKSMKLVQLIKKFALEAHAG